MYKVVGVGEPPKTSGSPPVPTCCSADTTIVSFPGTDVGNDGKDVSSDGRDVRGLLSLDAVGSDVLIERAGVDAGMVSLEVRTTEPELSREYTLSTLTVQYDSTYASGWVLTYSVQFNPVSKHG